MVAAGRAAGVTVKGLSKMRRLTMTGLEWVSLVIVVGGVLLFLGLNWAESEAVKREEGNDVH